MGCELRVFEASNKIKACLMSAKGIVGVVLQVYSSDGSGTPSMVEVSEAVPVAGKLVHDQYLPFHSIPVPCRAVPCPRLHGTKLWVFGAGKQLKSRVNIMLIVSGSAEARAYIVLLLYEDIACVKPVDAHTNIALCCPNSRPTDRPTDRPNHLNVSPLDVPSHPVH